jgi:acyl-CoA synthetase (AMP-forming)/AMP-acid ligase II
VRRDALVAARAVAAPPGAPDAVALVSAGRPLPGCVVQVRDLHGGGALPERVVGEIVVRGAAASPGPAPEVGALLARREVRTGDLGYWADGRLYLVDRLRDATGPRADLPGRLAEALRRVAAPASPGLRDTLRRLIEHLRAAG